MKRILSAILATSVVCSTTWLTASDRGTNIKPLKHDVSYKNRGLFHLLQMIATVGNGTNAMIHYCKNAPEAIAMTSLSPDTSSKKTKLNNQSRI